VSTISDGTPSPPPVEAVDPSAGDAPVLEPRPGRIAARMARVVENALGAVELSLPQYRMLIFLAEGGSDAASVLAGKLGVSRPSVTALVDGLVARGWAERGPDPTDRRRVAHTVTPAGLEVLSRADDAVEQRLAELAEAIPDAHRDVAYAGLNHWLVAMNTEREAKLLQQ
jgi:long-chain acyl-CoA synthetase